MESNSDKSNNIKFGRFSSSIPNLNKSTHIGHKIRRIPSVKPKKNSHLHYTMIAVENKSIYYSQEFYSARDFFTMISENTSNLLVITYKEKYNILDIAIDFNIRIYVFEELFPIFPSPSYFLSPKNKIILMKKRIAWLYKKSIFETSLGIYVTKKYLYQISRKTRFKNVLDMYFAFTQQNGYQECFKALECRTDRVIMSFDYNSMYPSCMLEKFPDPKNLQHIKIDKKYHENMVLDEGIYRVVLKNCVSNFFRKFHPFIYKNHMKNYLFNLEENHQIEILLHKCEIEAYNKFFEHIHLIEGITSNSISHPLKNKVQSLYNIKKNLKAQKNNIDYNLISFQLQTLHSSTSVKKYISKKFDNSSSLLKYLNDNFMMDICSTTTINEINRIFDGRYFSILSNKNKIILRHIDFSSDFNIHCLSSTIAAKARVKIFNTLYKSTQFHGTEVCYVNVDSVHLSILSCKKREFLKHMSSEISYNNEIGKLKLQCTANVGVWLDVGRYWLKKNGNVVMYKNKVFNHIGSRCPYIEKKIIKRVISSSSFIYVQKNVKTIGNTLSFSKRLASKCIDHAPLSRYSYSEVCDTNVAGKTYDREKLLSRQFYIDLFIKTATN